MIEVFKQIFTGIVSQMTQISIFGVSLWDLSIGFAVLGLAIAALRSLFMAGGD